MPTSSAWKMTTRFPAGQPSRSAQVFAPACAGAGGTSANSLIADVPGPAYIDVEPRSAPVTLGKSPFQEGLDQAIGHQGRLARAGQLGQVKIGHREHAGPVEHRPTFSRMAASKNDRRKQDA